MGLFFSQDFVDDLIMMKVKGLNRINLNFEEQIKFE